MPRDNKKKSRRIVFLGLLLLAFGIFMIAEDHISLSGITSNIIKDPQMQAPSETGPEPMVYFCPDDGCAQRLSELVAGAQESVHCAFFDLDLEDVIFVLEQRSRDTDVKIVLDTDNYEANKAALAFLHDDGRIVTDDRSAYMHNKFCIVDGSVVATGSFNPTERGDGHNNNNLIVIRSMFLSENYEDEFAELWERSYDRQAEVRYPKIIFNNKTIENYFCPEDCVQDKRQGHSGTERMIELIGKAESGIDFMTFSFTSDEIGDAVIAARERGIEVRGIFEKSQNNQWLEYHRMQEKGMDIAWDANPANMHHKVFIIDKKIVVTGSTNPSNNGFTRNDENILILHDRTIAKRYSSEFERLWNESLSAQKG